MKVLSTALALAAGLSLTASSGWAAPNSVGRAVSATDTVTGQYAGRTDVIATRDPIFQDQRISANRSGLGQFLLLDGAKLVVGPGASIVVDNFVHGGGGAKKILLKATKGAFRFISGNSGSHAYSIVTPTATIGIRGTLFDFTVQGGRTYLTLLRGEVRLCGGGQCQTLNKPCDFAVASSNGVTRPQSLASNTVDDSISARFPLLRSQSKLLSGFRAGSCNVGTSPTPNRQTAKALAAPVAVSNPPAPNPPAPSAKKGNPGNNKAVGNAGESPGNGNFGSGDRGKSNAPGKGKGKGKGRV